jgi:hypothetical protein
MVNLFHKHENSNGTTRPLRNRLFEQNDLCIDTAKNRDRSPIRGTSVQYQRDKPGRAIPQDDSDVQDPRVCVPLVCVDTGNQARAVEQRMERLRIDCESRTTLSR